MEVMELLNKKYPMFQKQNHLMTNEMNLQLNHLKQTTDKILDVLQSVKTELTEFKEEMHEFKTETEEKFELIIENAVPRTEFEQAIAKMATKEQLTHFTDRMDAKFLDLKHAITEGIRRSDKKFHAFAM